MRDPAREALEAVAALRQEFGGKGHARLDRVCLAGLAVLDLEVRLGVVIRAGPGEAQLPEEGCQSLVIRELPFLEERIVALGTVDAKTEERTGHTRGQAVRV